jgi:hypothetical protein
MLQKVNAQNRLPHIKQLQNRSVQQNDISSHKTWEVNEKFLHSSFMQSPPESLLNGVHILHDCEWLSNTE